MSESPASAPTLAQRLALSGASRAALTGQSPPLATKRRRSLTKSGAAILTASSPSNGSAQPRGGGILDRFARAYFEYLCEPSDAEAARLLGKAAQANSARLKGLARAASMHSSWQRVGKAQLGGLRKQLVEKRREVRLFKQSVIDTAAKAAQSCSRKWKKEGGEAPVESVLGPCVHFVPSGSGSFVKTGSGRVVVLTCAHCVDHNDDYDDDGDAGDASESGDDDETAPARKSRRYRRDNDAAAAASATQPVVPIKCDARGAGRVGRCLTMVWPNGEVALTRCLAANDRSDVAIMELLYRESPVGGGIADSVAVASVSASPVAVDTPIVCIHNPYDWDLELKSGATPRRSGYTPFTTSAGSIDGYRTGDRTDASDLGAVIHSAWTYWGTSGAPLFNMQGEIVAIHNSWNPSNADRHAVPFETLAGFLATY